MEIDHQARGEAAWAVTRWPAGPGNACHSRPTHYLPGIGVSTGDTNAIATIYLRRNIAWMIRWSWAHKNLVKLCLIHGRDFTGDMSSSVTMQAIFSKWNFRCQLPSNYRTLSVWMDNLIRPNYWIELVMDGTKWKSMFPGYSNCWTPKQVSWKSNQNKLVLT